MNANRKFFIAAGATALVLAAGSAAFADEPVFNGTTGSAPTSTVVNGSSTTKTTGSESVAPYTAVTTTVQNQTVNSTTAPTTTAISGTVGGQAYTGTVTVSGTGSQNQTSTTTLTQVYNPGPPPTPNGPPVPGGPIITPVGTATITEVSASGWASSSGKMPTPSYESTLTSYGAVVNGTVTAEEDAKSASVSGETWSQYIGTATYNPGTGNVTVSLPSAPTATTSIGAGGISTSGSVDAATVSAGTVTATNVSAGTVTAGTVNATQVNATSIALTPVNAGNSVINAGGGRITNLANGIAPGDAVNLYQLQAGLNNLSKVAAQGTAVAAAMSGAYFLPGKKFSVNLNLSDYLGEGAFAFNAGYLDHPEHRDQRRGGLGLQLRRHRRPDRRHLRLLIQHSTSRKSRPVRRAGFSLSRHRRGRKPHREHAVRHFGRLYRLALVGALAGAATGTHARGFLNSENNWEAMPPDARAAYVQGLNELGQFHLHQRRSGHRRPEAGAHPLSDRTQDQRGDPRRRHHQRLREQQGFREPAAHRRLRRLHGTELQDDHQRGTPAPGAAAGAVALLCRRIA